MITSSVAAGALLRMVSSIAVSPRVTPAEAGAQSLEQPVGVAEPPLGFRLAPE
jgi:hypothetical protein